ncbi:hypothetical protein AM571_CH01819 [Rhizobium etli 8C-3]|uniref:Uncharacterized protein n=1 Tax=Rhizobium etli 8C-3 TaxID=538025 RepID=A0A1L5P3A6_RHIET|nr:hypothetical protein AM571_CH01819 [Rhizobium etli 8C-3]
MTGLVAPITRQDGAVPPLGGMHWNLTKATRGNFSGVVLIETNGVWARPPRNEGRKTCRLSKRSLKG